MGKQINPKMMALVPLFILGTSLNTLGIALASGGWWTYLLMAAGLGAMFVCLVKATGVWEQATKNSVSPRGLTQQPSLVQRRMPNKSTKSETESGLAQAFYRVFSKRVVTESPSDCG